MSGRSPSQPGSRSPEAPDGADEGDYDDVTDAAGLSRELPGRRVAGADDPAAPEAGPDPRLAEAIRRLQDAQVGAWDESTLEDLPPDEPMREEITGPLSRFLENALKSQLAALDEEDASDEVEEPQGTALTEPDRLPLPPVRRVPLGPSAESPRRSSSTPGPSPTPRPSPTRPSSKRRAASEASSRLARGTPPSSPRRQPQAFDSEPLESKPLESEPEPTLPTVPDPDLIPVSRSRASARSRPRGRTPAAAPPRRAHPDPIDAATVPDTGGSWDETSLLSSYDDDLGPVDEFTLSIHPELVRQALDKELTPESPLLADGDELQLDSLPDGPVDETPTMARYAVGEEVSRLRALLGRPDSQSVDPIDAPTQVDEGEHTLAIPEDPLELTVSDAGVPVEGLRERTMDILAAIADAPGDADLLGAALEPLGELMSVHEAPPGGEETIGTSLRRLDELISLADAPADNSEPLGAALERIDLGRLRKPAKPRRGERPPPPLQDETRVALRPAAEPLDEVARVLMPEEVVEPRPGQDLRRRPPPRRPQRPRATRPSDELTQALPKAYQRPLVDEMTQAPSDMGRGHVHEEKTQARPDVFSSRQQQGNEEKTQALPDAYLPYNEGYARSAPPAEAAAATDGAERTSPPAGRRSSPPEDSTSSLMRRETYQPGANTSSWRRGAPPDPPRQAVPVEYLEEDDDPYKEPILQWAAALFGLVIVGGAMVLFLLLVLIVF